MAAAVTQESARPQSSAWRLGLFFLLGIIGFAPILRIAGVPLPLIFLFAPLPLFAKRIILWPKQVWIGALLVSLYLLVVSLLNKSTNPYYELKDLSYFALPLQFLCSVWVFQAVFRAREDSRGLFITFCQIFLIVQFLFVVAEFANISAVTQVIKPYISWFLLNTSSTDIQAETLNLRPGGTMGNPVFVGITGYLLGRLVAYASKKPWFLILGVVLMLLTASRAATLGVAVAEGFVFLVSSRKTFTRRQVMTVAAGAGVLLAGVVAMFALVPFMRDYALAALGSETANSGGISSDYSVTYRAEITDWALHQTPRLVTGGLSLAEAPPAVDSEILMRSLQFGVLGYILLQFPVMSLVYIGRRLRDADATKYGIGLLIFCLICSATFSPFSNPFFITWYGAIAAYWLTLHKASPPEEPA